MNIYGFIEEQRIKQKVKKSDMCRAAEISRVYYYKIIAGEASPALPIIQALLKKVNYQLMPMPLDVLQMLKSD
jgi:DNA-binding phage protein